MGQLGEGGREGGPIHAKPCGSTRGGRIQQSKGYLGEEDPTEHRVPQGGVGRGGGTPSPLRRCSMMPCGDQGI